MWHRLCFGHSCSKGRSGYPGDTVALDAFSAGCCFSPHTFRTPDHGDLVTGILTLHCCFSLPLPTTPQPLTPLGLLHPPLPARVMQGVSPHACSRCLSACALSTIILADFARSLSHALDETAIRVISSLLAPALKQLNTTGERLIIFI